MDGTTLAESASVEKREEPSQLELTRRLVYLAAERTLLLWIRTGLTLMAVGFGAQQLGWVLMGMTKDDRYRASAHSFTLWIGCVLLGTGVLTNAVAAWRYVRFAKRYRNGDSDPGHGISIEVMLSLVVAGIGIAALLYLARVQMR